MKIGFFELSVGVGISFFGLNSEAVMEVLMKQLIKLSVLESLKRGLFFTGKGRVGKISHSTAVAIALTDSG